MAKSQIKLAESEDETATREAAEEMVALNQATGGDLFTAIEEIRGSAAASQTVVLVTRVATDGRSGGYCGKIAINDFTLEKIKALYGAGKYTTQIKGPKGFVPGGSGIEIADTIDTMPKPASPGGDFMSYLEFQRIEQAERRAKTNELLAIAIPTLGTVLAAFVNRSQGPDISSLIAALKPNPAPTLQELSAAMVNLQTLSAPKSSSDPIDTVLKVFEAARDMSEGGGAKVGSSNWIDILRDLIKEVPSIAGPVLQGLQRQAALRAGAQANIAPTANIAPPPAIPVAANASATSGAPIAEHAELSFAGVAAGSSESDMWIMMKPFMLQKLKVISGWAQAKKNPELYAEVFLAEHVPENFADYLPPDKALEYLRHTNWFAKTSEWEPSLATYREWCDEFRLELIALISMGLDQNANGPRIDAGDTKP